MQKSQGEDNLSLAFTYISSFGIAVSALFPAWAVSGKSKIPACGFCNDFRNHGVVHAAMELLCTCSYRKHGNVSV